VNSMGPATLTGARRKVIRLNATRITGRSRDEYHVWQVRSRVANHIRWGYGDCSHDGAFLSSLECVSSHHCATVVWARQNVR